MSPMGGPGWLSDIFECKLVFDDACYKLVPDDFAKITQKTNAKIKCFDGRGAISGKLIVLPPEGRDVTHQGIEITLSSCTHVGPDAAEDTRVVVHKSWTLLSAGSVNEPIECEFDINLAEIPLRDTFDGQHMFFRHSLSYRIIRPWYTFSVRGEEAIAIRNCETPSPPLPEKTVLCLDDFGAECTFDHGKCTFSADGQLVGTVSFRNMSAASSVAEVAVMLGRSEKWSKFNGTDAEVRIHKLHTAEQAPIDTDVTLAVDIALPTMGTIDGLSAPTALPPTMPPLEPTDPTTDEENVVEVEYWLRLLVTKPLAPGQKEATKHWDTHAIILEPCSDSFGI